MKFRPPKPQYMGFESILLQESSITYDILCDGYSYNAGAHTANGTPSSITLQRGDLLIVPRGVARQVSKITTDTKYLYIGDPWSKEDLPVEIQLRRTEPEE